MLKEEQNKVVELYISTNTNKKRSKNNEIQLDENGVLKDRFYAKNSNRLILVTTLGAYALAKENNIKIFHGDLGENILIDADISHLRAGDTLKIGEVLLEVTQNCTLCNGLSVLNPKLPKILKDDRGVFVKTVTNGTIKIGDRVII